jgi:DNA topoisomerase IB/type II secretory pathway pseudopilin PulG
MTTLSERLDFYLSDRWTVDDLIEVQVDEQVAVDWKELLHPREKGGKFTSKSGGGAAVAPPQALTPQQAMAQVAAQQAMAQQQAVQQAMVQQALQQQQAAQQAATKPHSRPKAKASAGGKPKKPKTVRKPVSKPKKPAPPPSEAKQAFAGLDEAIREQLTKLKVKLPLGPGTTDLQVKDHKTLSGDGAHAEAVATWRDSKGRLQMAYTQEFRDRKDALKWAKIEKLEPKATAVRKDLLKRVTTEKLGSAGHASATVLAVIAQTGLRIGSTARPENYGVSTMLPEHVRFEGGEAHIQYRGKHGKENNGVIRDPKLVATLRFYRDKAAPGDAVFATGAARVRKESPAGWRPKDFRTIVATEEARRATEEYQGELPTPAMSRKKQIKLLKAAERYVSNRVAKLISNTPAVAKKSYIHPKVFKQWAEKLGVDLVERWHRLDIAWLWEGAETPKAKPLKITDEMKQESEDYDDDLQLDVEWYDLPEILDVEDWELEETSTAVSVGSGIQARLGDPVSTPDEDEEDEEDLSPIGKLVRRFERWAQARGLQELITQQVVDDFARAAAPGLTSSLKRRLREALLRRGRWEEP